MRREGCHRITQEDRRGCTEGEAVSVCVDLPWLVNLLAFPTHATMQGKRKWGAEFGEVLSERALGLHKLPSPWEDWNMTPMYVHQSESCCESQRRLVGYSLARTTEVESQEGSIRVMQHEAISWGMPGSREACMSVSLTQLIRSHMIYLFLSMPTSSPQREAST